MLIVQDKWHVDSEVKTGSVAFLVLLWQCLRHLTSLCFCACSGWPDFPAPSAYLKSHGELSAPLFWPQLCRSVLCRGFHQQLNVFSSVGWLLRWCCGVAEGELGLQAFKHVSLCSPSWAWGQGLLTLSWQGLPSSNSTF